MNRKIKQYREQNGLTQEALAERIDTSQQQIQRLENGERCLTSEWIKKLADALHVSPMVFFEEDAKASPNRLSDAVVKQPFKAADTVPVYGFAAAGEDGLILNSNFIAEYAPRPSLLADVADGFMVYVSSAMMEPRYFQGEKILIHPRRLPKSGEDCLIVRKDGHGFIRVFQGQDAHCVTVQCYNPAGIQTLDRTDVKGIYAVIGREN